MNRNIEPSITEISRPSQWGHQQITLPNGIEIVYLHDPNQEVFKMPLPKLQSCLIIMEHTWISIAVCTKLN